MKTKRRGSTKSKLPSQRDGSIGRPTVYTDAVGEELCRRLIEPKPQSLSKVCTSSDDMPCIATAFRWLREHPTFCATYERALIDRAMMYADESVDILDDGAQGGDNIVRVGRDRERSSARRWWSARIDPRRFGDRGVGRDPSVDEKEQYNSKLVEAIGAMRDAGMNVTRPEEETK